MSLQTVKYPRSPIAHSKLRLSYHRANNSFPQGTKGVFYFHHVAQDNVQSQLRFRLCNTVDDFPHGEDLRLPDGSFWNVSLRAMAKVPSSYHPVLNILRKEFPLEPLDVDSSLNCHRMVSTFDPKKLPSSSQGVVDISDLTAATLRLVGSGRGGWPLFYSAGTGGDASHRKASTYPPGTVGVYYFKQSIAAPTRVGELRFRLCRDLEGFHQGTDLCLPSGEIWHISTLTILASERYKELRNFLSAEGLLDDALHLDVAGTMLTTPHPTIVPLRVLNTPFMVDLSASQITFTVPPSITSKIRAQHLFRNTRFRPLFSGMSSHRPIFHIKSDQIRRASCSEI